MKLTEEQKKFIYFDGKESVILKATAGSGKTWCCVQRLKYLLKKGVKPEKIIFFSYTNAAVNELKERIENDSIKITTIHSFCMGFLKRIGKAKEPVTFFDFISWYRKKRLPVEKEEQEIFEEQISLIYDEADYFSSKISSYKLQMADDILVSKIPDYLDDYNEFLEETNGMDFCDMLIETKKYLKDNRYLRMIKNQYDYIFVDEYQDTSTVQMDILLRLNAKYYYIIGDVNQSIFSYSGASCEKIEEMLQTRRKTLPMSLSTNFRSATSIIENSNKYSSLKAVPHHEHPGKVKLGLLYFNELEEMIRKDEREVAILVRTNEVIRKLEMEFLKRRVPIRYFNYINPDEIKKIKSNKTEKRIDKKLKILKPFFDDDHAKIVQFIEQNKNQKSFITTIHKSKGREFDICTVVNSLSPEIVDYNELKNKLSEELLEYFSFDSKSEEDFESKNVHYVAISRPKEELYFMLYIPKS